MPSSAWQADSPAEAGFAVDLGDKLEFGLRSGLLRDLHAVLIVRSGRIVLERYFQGPDERWGDSLGRVSFGRDTLHDLQSVTKSIVGLLYGIALNKGLVPPPDAPLLEQFPQYSGLAGDPRRARITVAHALTMTLGLEWDELRSYRDPRNSETAMERAPDRLRYVLERPIVAPPGTLWTYNGGAAALLGALIGKGSGLSLADFARDSLFEPLGISNFEWVTGGDGAHLAASGLRLTARDLARIGELVHGRGQWAGRQIVPRGLDQGIDPQRCRDRRRPRLRSAVVSRSSAGAGAPRGSAALGGRLRQRWAEALAHAVGRHDRGRICRKLQQHGSLDFSNAGLARNCRRERPGGLAGPQRVQRGHGSGLAERRPFH